MSDSTSAHQPRLRASQVAVAAGVQQQHVCVAGLRGAAAGQRRTRSAVERAVDAGAARLPVVVHPDPVVACARQVDTKRGRSSAVCDVPNLDFFWTTPRSASEVGLPSTALERSVRPCIIATTASGTQQGRDERR